MSLAEAGVHGSALVLLLRAAAPMSNAKHLFDS